jgi:hypothetical protein
MYFYCSFVLFLIIENQIECEPARQLFHPVLLVETYLYLVADNTHCVALTDLMDEAREPNNKPAELDISRLLTKFSARHSCRPNHFPANMKRFSIEQ